MLSEKQSAESQNRSLLWENYPSKFKLFDKVTHEANTTIFQPKAFVSEWTSCFEQMDQLFKDEIGDCDKTIEALVDVSDLAIPSVGQSVENYINQGMDKLGNPSQKIKTSNQNRRHTDEVAQLTAIVDSLNIKPQQELLTSFNGEPKDQAEAAYLPLETMKLTDSKK